MRIIFAGSGEFGLPTLAALLEARHEISLVISQPDRPAGRGRHLQPTPIAKFALERNCPLLRTENINNEKLPEADLLVVIAFGQKISPEQVNHARLGAVNLHGSKLPKFRGAAPVNAAIIAGEAVSGNSIIRLAQKMDAGAILAQSTLQIGELETAGELHDRLATDGAPLMLDLVAKLERGQATETPQDESAATLAPKMKRESARIDWNSSADKIARQIRGMYPWPGCHVRLMDQNGQERSRATLVRARQVEEASNDLQGRITSAGTLGCGTGLLEVVEIQPENKRPMPLKAFCNGHPWQEGMHLEST